MVPHLFYPVDDPQHDPVVGKAREFTGYHLEPILHEWSAPPQPLVHGLVLPYHFHSAIQIVPHVESSLSRVIALIVSELTRSFSKYLTVRIQWCMPVWKQGCRSRYISCFVIASVTRIILFQFGCCHALSLLSDKYLITQYASAWGCAPLSLPGDRNSVGKNPPGRSFSNSSTGRLVER